MREKTDLNKLLEGRGMIDGNSYAAWRRASEAKSTGTSVMLNDPISNRSVSLLSQGERYVYWMLRFHPQVAEIYEQAPLLDTQLVNALCYEYGIPGYQKILSTDFIVKSTEGAWQGISVKPDRKYFDPKNSSYTKRVNRQVVEKEYWKAKGVPWKIIFAEDVNKEVAINIESCMLFWDDRLVHNETSMLKHLIAHKIIQVQMDKPIPFTDLVREYDVRRVYADYKNNQ